VCAVEKRKDRGSRGGDFLQFTIVSIDFFCFFFLNRVKSNLFLISSSFLSFFRTSLRRDQKRHDQERSTLTLEQQAR
jgi:hypothetical protein